MKKISIFVIVSLFLLTSSAFADTTSDLYKVADGITGAVKGSGTTSTTTTAGPEYSQLKYEREKLKGTDKTMSDYKPTTPTTTKRLTCNNCVCDCTVSDTTSTAPATTPAPTTKAATGKGTTSGGGTSKPK